MIRLFLQSLVVVSTTFTGLLALEAQSVASDIQKEIHGNEQTMNAYKKEWIGEPGYVNCLLVTMSRMRIREIQLSTSQPLPNLDNLSLARPDTNKWINAQNLQYDQLDKLTVIIILAESAGISPKTGNRTGSIIVHDAVGSDGAIIQRAFDMRLDFIGKEPTLTIVQSSLAQ